MDMAALKNYDTWIDKSPLMVHSYVIHAGGWKRVFWDGVPRWASRVRNYFNVTPQKLTQMSDEQSEIKLREVQTAIVAADCANAKRVRAQIGIKQLGPAIHKYGAPKSSVLPDGCSVEPDMSARMGFNDTLGTRHALSGEVYTDESGLVWYQMDPGAAIYHYGEIPWWPGGRAFWASVILGQRQIPVFKLVSPDGTGGSRECIITNPQEEWLQLSDVIGSRVKAGRSDIGAVNVTVDVSGRIEKDPVKQGSYNYAETVVEGLAAHKRFDVETDPMNAMFFVDPLNRFSLIFSRRFPPNDQGGHPLADQVKY